MSQRRDPEEDRCIDIYELIEHEKLLAFHVQTLKLYSALCYQSNYRAQHAICHYCDGRQLLYSIKSEFMPGQLRMGFFDTLIALHLESYVNSVETSQNEYIVPMGAELRDLYSGAEGDTKNSMKSLRYESVRPTMHVSAVSSDTSGNGDGGIKDLMTPAFPLDTVRDIVMEALEQAVQVNQVHNRDPIGGTNQDLFVPLFKILDKLLMAGALTDSDVEQLLIMIHPQTWDPAFEKGKIFWTAIN